MKIYRCTCGHLHPGDDAPEKCPECEAARDAFEMIQDDKELTSEEDQIRMSLADFQEMTRTTITDTIKGMSAVDRRHAAMPGQNNDEAMKLERHERIIGFFRQIATGDISAARTSLMEIEQRTSLNETTDSQGAVLVPVEFQNEVLRIVDDTGLARRECRVIPMTRKSKEIPYLASGVTAYWVGEGNAITKGEPTFGLRTLTAKKLAALLAGTEEFFEDAVPEMMSLLAQLTAEAMAQAETYQLFNGTGSSPAITGVLNTTGVNVVTLGSGLTGFSDVTLAGLRGLPNALSDGARDGAKYYLNYNILNHLAGIQDGNSRPVWVEANGGIPAQLMGKNYVESSQMPGDSASAADTPFVTFGNFKKCVVLGDRKQMTVKLLDQATIGSENLGEEVKTALRFHNRVDIVTVLPTGLSRLKTSAT